VPYGATVHAASPLTVHDAPSMESVASPYTWHDAPYMEPVEPSSVVYDCMEPVESAFMVNDAAYVEPVESPYAMHFAKVKAKKKR
jgi:hypothetical protein